MKSDYLTVMVYVCPKYLSMKDMRNAGIRLRALSTSRNKAAM
jgi:hypothetical protein